MSKISKRIKDDTKLYMAIKEAIQSGAFPPGHRLIERDLAEQFGVSRTPVRSALNRLSIEGYVEQSPHRGSVVKKLTVDDIKKLLDIREVLEGRVCKLAAENAKEEDKLELEKIINDMKQIVRQNDYLKYYRLSGELHNTIMRCCDNSYLIELAEKVNLQTTRFQFRNILVPGRIEKSVEEHSAIVEKIISGNSIEAEECMKEHIRIVRGMIEDNEDIYKDPFLTY